MHNHRRTQGVLAEDPEVVALRPKTIVLTGYGINCDLETAYAFKLAGAEVRRVHLNDLIWGRDSLKNYQILALPGGFSFGDDIASGKVLANKIKYNLGEQIREFVGDGKLVIGICNGFQVMVKMGLLPCPDYTQTLTLTFNDSGRFEDRWVYLKVNGKSPCIYTKNIEKLYLPVRHGEGKLIPKNQEALNKLHEKNNIVLQYVDEKGNLAGYPFNPNGSIDSIAGICDTSGRILGMMPHPEAYLHRTNHPRWSRENLPEEGMGVQIFRNAVEYAEERLT